MPFGMIFRTSVFPAAMNSKLILSNVERHAQSVNQKTWLIFVSWVAGFVQSVKSIHFVYVAAQFLRKTGRKT